MSYPADQLKAVERTPLLARLVAMIMIEITGDEVLHYAPRFHSYSTVLMKLFLDVNGIRRELHIGSGTYVKIGALHGILTAQHCTEPLEGDCVLALSAADEDIEHNFIVSKSTIRVLDIAKPKKDPLGPDLAFIILADFEKFSRIHASKKFFDLLQHQERMLNNPPSTESCIWYLCGVPHERMDRTESLVGFDELIYFQDYCCAVGFPEHFTNGEYDYLDIDFTSGYEHVIPSNFEGMSGGSLWQVPVHAQGPMHLDPSDHNLAGVIFYQGVREDKTRFLRCHGIQSLYRKVIDAVL